MKSTTFSCSWHIFKTALKRNIWFVMIYSLVLFCMAPLRIINIHTNSILNENIYTNIFETCASLLTWTSSSNFNFTLALAPIIASMLVFRFLNHRKQADYMHSLPNTRTTLFIGHYCCGLFMLLIPPLLNGIVMLTLKAANITPACTYTDIMFWMNFSMFMSLVVYSYGVFAGSLLGLTSLQGILSFILLIIIPGLDITLNALFAVFYPSYYNTNIIDSAMFSPLINIYYGYSSRTAYYLEQSNSIPYITFGISFIMLTLAAYWLYRLRPVESAGKPVVFKPLQIILLYLATFCFSLVGASYYNSIESNLTLFVIGAFGSGFAGYLICRMILAKSFRGPYKLKGFAAYALVLALFMSTLHMDIWGFERRTFEPSSLQSITFNSQYINIGQTSGIKNPTLIAKLVELHESLVNSGSEAHKVGMPSFMISFSTKSGETIFRKYTFDPIKYRAQLESIVNAPELKEQNSINKQTRKERPINRITINAPIFSNRMENEVIIEDPTTIKELIPLMEEERLNTPWTLESHSRKPLLEFAANFVNKDETEQLFSVPIVRENSKLMSYIMEKKLLNRLISVDQVQSIKIQKGTPEAYSYLNDPYGPQKRPQIDPKKSFVTLSDKSDIKNCLNIELYNFWGWSLKAPKSIYILQVEKTDGQVLESCFIKDAPPSFIQKHFNN